MTDPLGLIGSAGGGVGGIGGLPRVGGAAQGPEDPNAPSFKDVLLRNIDQANKLQQEATAAAEDLATGKRADIEGVVAATQKADAAFRMLVSVRNRMQTAFEEIKQIRV
jgi:flagellar hook-basal body complex protein FliE